LRSRKSESLETIVNPLALAYCQIATSQSTQMHMGRVRIDKNRCLDKGRREVFVEEQLHALNISSLRSRSAAGKAGAYISFGKIWEIAQNLFMRHSAREILEHVIHGDPQPSDARLAAALSGLDRDDVRVRHIVHSMRKRRGQAFVFECRSFRKGIEQGTKWTETIVYVNSELLEWVEARRAFIKRKIRVFAFANNHYAGHGPATVRLFLKLLEKNVT